MILLPLHLVYAPPPPPAPPSGNVLPLTNALTHSLDSIRKIYLQKILQKLRKCKNQVPIKVPFYPHICPPWSPYPRSNFFVSKQSLDIYLESILMNYLHRLLQKLKKWGISSPYLVKIWDLHHIYQTKSFWQFPFSKLTYLINTLLELRWFGDYSI